MFHFYQKHVYDKAQIGLRSVKVRCERGREKRDPVRKREQTHKKGFRLHSKVEERGPGNEGREGKIELNDHLQRMRSVSVTLSAVTAHF